MGASNLGIKPRQPPWVVEKEALCPCGSGIKFQACCKQNEILCGEAFSFLEKGDYPKAEIALRAKLTEYTGFIFRHTLFLIETSSVPNPNLIQIDVCAIEEVSHALAISLKEQGKANGIIPLFEHVERFIPLPGIAARMAFLKAIHILEITHNIDEAKVVLRSFKGLSVCLDAKLLGLYLDLFKEEMPKVELARIEQCVKSLESYEKFSGPNPFEDYEKCLQKFQKPAGDDPRFASHESFESNIHAFIEITHRAYKEIHFLGIAHIVSLELVLGCYKRVLSQRLKHILQYRIQLWRRLNDAIAWQILRQEQHAARAVCFHKNRGPLVECNPNSIIPLLAQLNEDHLKIAIWTDSTAGVDIGDILMADFATGAVTFAEVKEGQVNKEILELISKPSLGGDAKLNDFLKRRGKHGAKQMLRVLNQHERNHQVTNLLKDEKGFDPSLGKEIKIIDITSIPDKSWDNELGKCLNAAKEKGEDLICIDNCLWVFATISAQPDFESVKLAFINGLKSRNAQTAIRWIEAYKPGDELRSIISLHEWAYAPARMPIYCRDLAVAQMMDITLGNVDVFLAFDWTEFENTLKQHSVEIVWSSTKEARQEKTKAPDDRRFIIGEKIISITKGDAKNFIGSKHLLRIYFDGVRPSSVAMQMNLLLDIQIREGLESKGPV